MKKVVLVLLLFIFTAAGCANRQISKSQLADAIKQNPQVILDVMRENSSEVLEIVEQGFKDREIAKRKAMFNAELKNPFKPVMLPGRAVVGSPDAPVTIVEYTDFFCPYCSKGAKVVRSLVAENPSKYRLMVKHLPLHKNSQKFAAIYEALSRIDFDLAFKFHDLVFENQKALYNAKNDAELNKIITELGVDFGRLQKELNSPSIGVSLASDDAEAKKFGFDVTPIFLVNGVTIRGYLPKDRFEKRIDEILEKTKALNPDDGEICEDCLNQM